MSIGLPKRVPVVILHLLSVVCVASALGQPMRWQAQSASVPKEHKRLAREQVEDMEGQWQKAQLADDVAGMDKLLSDDYIGITFAGEVLTKAQQLDHMRSRKLVITSMETSERKIKLVGPIAIVTSLAQVEGSSDGEAMHGGFRYTRVYQRLPNGAWKITNFEATRIPNRPPRQRPVTQ